MSRRERCVLGRRLRGRELFMVDARPSPRGLKRLATLLLWLGALAYISTIGEAIVGWPFDIHDSYLSELAARQYPRSWLFRLTDLLSGVAIFSGTLLFVRQAGFQAGLRRSASIEQGKGALRAGWGSFCLFRRALATGLSIFALATIIDSTVTPLDCALSLPECREQIEAGEAGRYEWMHDASSVAVGVGTVTVACSLILIVLFRHRARYSLGMRIAASSLAASVVLLVGFLTGAELLGAGPVGLVQRIQVSLTGVLIAFAPAGFDPEGAFAVRRRRE